jgi:hypothetical protein
MAAVTSQTTGVSLSINPTLIKVVDPITTVTGALSALSFSDTLINGTGAASAKNVYMAEGTFASAGSATLDLYGSLANIFGDTINAAHVKLIAVFNKATPTVPATGHTLKLGHAATEVPYLEAPTSCSILIPAGGCIVLYAGQTDPNGWAVTNSTGDKITLTSGGEDAGAMTYDIVVVFE